MRSIPIALVHSTSNAATRFLTAQTVLPGAAALLAQGVLRSISITQWLKAGSILLVASVTVAGVGLLAERETSGAQPRKHEKSQAAAAAGASDFVVKAGKLKVAVVERGSLESSNVSDRFCNIEGETTIIWIVAEGTKVKKGDVVCQLDSARLKDQLLNQQIATESANAAHESSKLAREVAKLAEIEYADGIFKQDLNALKSEIAAAQSAIQKTESRLERTRLARERLNGLPPKNGGAKGRDEIVIDLDLDDRVEAIEQALLREQKAFELAKNKLELLEMYSRHKTIKVLQIEVERKHSDELVKEAMWERERSNQAKLERQLAACTLVAPVDSLVVYGNVPSQTGGQSEIEEGALVVHRRKIITVFDLSRIQVIVKLPESHVDKIKPNMKARIRVDAFPDELLTGTVRDVAPRPDRSVFSKSGIKVYPTHVQIDEPLAGLVPGMTALAEIPIDDLDNVLSTAEAFADSCDRAQKAKGSRAGAIASDRQSSDAPDL